jgi:hypothetical protein
MEEEEMAKGMGEEWRMRVATGLSGALSMPSMIFRKYVRYL